MGFIDGQIFSVIALTCSVRKCCTIIFVLVTPYLKCAPSKGLAHKRAVPLCAKHYEVPIVVTY